MPNHQIHTPYAYLIRSTEEGESQYSLFVSILHHSGEEVHQYAVEYANGTTLVEYIIKGEASDTKNTQIYYHRTLLDSTNDDIIGSSVHISCRRETLDFYQAHMRLNKFTRIYYEDAEAYDIPIGQNIAFNCPYLFLNNIYAQERLTSIDHRLVSSFDPYCMVPLSGLVIDEGSSKAETNDGSYIQTIVLEPSSNTIQETPEFVHFDKIEANTATYSEVGQVDGSFEALVIIYDLNGEQKLRKGRVRNADSDTDNNDFIDISPF